MSKNKKTNGSDPSEPSWKALMLICKDCRRRKDGPKQLKAKVLASNIKALMKATVPQGRIVLTTCLKLCPRRATAIAFVTAVSTPRIIAVESSDQLEHMLPRLTGA